MVCILGSENVWVSVDVGIVGVAQRILGEGQVARFMGIDIGPGGGVDKGEDTRSDTDDFTVPGVQDRQIFEDSASNIGGFKGHAGGVPEERTGEGGQRMEIDVVEPICDLEK